MDRGEYFFLKSHLTGLVVTATKNGQVQMEAKKAINQDDQLWYHHEQTLTLRSRLNGQCTHCVDSTITVQPYNVDCADVCKWQIKDTVIHLTTDPNRVLSIEKANPNPQATLTISTNNGGADKNWQIEFTDPPYFYIRSLLSPRVLDVKGGDKVPRTKVITYKQQGYMASNQLWFTDKTGTIRSKLNNFSLDVMEGSFVCLMPCDGSRADQQWRFEEGFIVNHSRPEEVLDINRNNAQDGAEILSWKKHGGKNQQWMLVYV